MNTIELELEKKYKDRADLENELMTNADDFIKHIIEKSKEILDLSELGIINLNLHTHGYLLNKITKIDISNNLLQKISFIPVHIVHLDLSSNKLKNVEFVKKLVNLKYLNISYNKNIIIEDDIFENSLNLESVEMAGINLKSIYNALFKNLEKLEYLNLAGNKLTCIDNIVFPPKIKVLNITCNNIQKEECEELAKKLSRVIF